MHLLQTAERGDCSMKLTCTTCGDEFEGPCRLCLYRAGINWPGEALDCKAPWCQECYEAGWANR